MDQETADEMLGVMRDVRTLLRVWLQDDIDQIVRDAFEGNDVQQEAFKLLGEGRSYREIGDKVDKSHTTVGRWVKKWRELGLISSVSHEDDYLLSPEVLGL